MSKDRAQQCDPQAPPLLAETIQALVKNLESKINVWYLIDRNLADNIKIVLRDLNKYRKKNYGLSLNTGKYDPFLGQTTSTQYKTIIGQFQNLCLKIKKKTKVKLVILGFPKAESCQIELLKRKIAELEKISEVIDKLDAHYGFYHVKKCVSMPKIFIFCVPVLIFAK